MENTFKVAGLSFRKTPIKVREKYTLNEVESKRLIQFLIATTEVSDVLVLSTCNRTEIYYNHINDLTNEIATAVALIKGVDKHELISHFTHLAEGEQTIRHLFDVSMGLDAQVVGDIQISNQVKKAYQWSADEGVAGPLLHRLMHSIFYTNKRVVQETSFRDGAASVSYATKDLIDDITTELQSPKILILGLGEIGQDVCRNYVGTNKSITVANRTYETAAALGLECGFDVVSFDDALGGLAAYDVVISSISHSQPTITKKLLEEFNILTHKFFIDLSVPRSIETSVEEIHGVLLYNIDNIRSKASEALNNRITAIPDVKNIIDQSIADFQDWSKEMIVSPTIKRLKNALEDIRKEELKRHLKNVNGEEYKIIETVTKSMMQKIIKLPVLQLKAACQRGEAETLIDVLNDLFDLEKQDVKA